MPGRSPRFGFCGGGFGVFWGGKEKVRYLLGEFVLFFFSLMQLWKKKSHKDRTMVESPLLQSLLLTPIWVRTGQTISSWVSPFLIWVSIQGLGWDFSSSDSAVSGTLSPAPTLPQASTVSIPSFPTGEPTSKNGTWKNISGGQSSSPNKKGWNFHVITTKRLCYKNWAHS